MSVIRCFVAVGVLTADVVTLAPCTPAHADEPAAPAPAASESAADLGTVVIEATAIPGGAIDVDKVAGNVQTLSAADLSRHGSANLTQALSSQLGSVNVNDNLDDSFQPDILYRGFEASPVLGTPQGLAVYQNGVRINEAFGDTVNWDLFPDIAIQRVDIVSSNPVYGLNALGGSVVVSMKNGFSHAGDSVELSGGSFRQHAIALQSGASSDHFGIYVAGKALNQGGWRDFAHDSLRQLYGALSARSERASIDLSYTRADNRLFGQGAAPVQELAVDRSLVFTGPQANLNRLDFVTLSGSVKVSDAWSLQSVLYYRHYAQNEANGNSTNYTACTDAAHAGELCQPDALTPLSNTAAEPLPDISAGGAVPIGENDFETIHAYGRGAALQTSASQPILGHANQFAAGATLDDARVDFFSGTQLGVINPALLVQPSNLIVDTPQSSPFGATPVSLRAGNRYYGLYATDTLDLTSALSLTAGARYNLAQIDLQDLRGADLSGNNRYSHFNPALGGTYKVRPTLSLYAGVSRNTRTPTASEIECSNPLQPCLLPSNLAGDPPNLRQVVAHTSEFGLRGNFRMAAAGAGKMSWNLGLFRTDLDDDIYGVATSLSSGFFQNIGSTRRQGVEANLNYQADKWSAYASYSYIDATFQSSLTLPSPSNPHRDAQGNTEVHAGDRLPGIPQHHFKTGVEYEILPHWTLGASLIWVSDQYYYGDESNQNAPMPGYHVIGLHSSYQVDRKIEVFGGIDNLFNARYATYGIYSDPTGVGAPGIARDAVTNGPGVDTRFQSPAAPLAAYGGVRVTF